MFSIGFIEVLMVAVVALLVMGPDRLPIAVRDTAVWVNRLRRQVGSLRREFEDQIEDMENDAVFADLTQGRQLLDNVKRDIKENLGSSSGSDDEGPKALPKP